MNNVDGFINLISGMFEKEYSPEGRGVLERGLSKFSAEVFAVVSKDLENSGDRFKPVPTELIAMCGKVHGDMQPRKPLYEPVPPADKRQAAMSLKLVGIILGGKATRGQILDNIRKAAGVKPDTGWELCGTNLERYYDRCGLSLDEPPANYVSYSDEL